MIHVAIFIALSQQAMTFEKGYYSLSDVAAVCSNHGQNVRVSTDCADEIYAIRGRNLSWPQLRSALTADGSLQIEDTKEGWLVSHSPTYSQDDLGKRNRYFSALTRKLNRLVGRAAHECRYIANLPDEEAQKAINIYSTVVDPDPVMAAGNHLIYLISGEHDLQFSSVAVPESFTNSPRQLADSGWVFSNVYDSRNLLNEKGDVNSLLKYFRFDPSKFNEQEAATRLRSIRLARRLSSEPISGYTVSSVLFQPQEQPAFVFAMGFELSPQYIRLTLDSDDVFTLEQRKGAEERTKETNTVLSSDICKQLYGPPPTPLVSWSAFLLNWAEKNNANLVAYVSPYSDFQVRLPHLISLESAFKAINDPKFQEVELNSYMYGALGEAWQGQQRQCALQIANKFTMSRQDSVYVVRDELRFIDAICPSPTLPSVNIANLGLQGKPVPLKSLVKVVVDLPEKSWTGGPYSTHFDAYCNPVTFRPFAVALQKSQILWDAIVAVKSEEATDIPFSKIEPEAVSAICTEVIDCAKIARSSQLCQQEPLFTQAYIETNRGKDLTLQVSRKADTLKLSILQLKTPIWAAEVTNISTP